MIGAPENGGDAALRLALLAASAEAIGARLLEQLPTLVAGLPLSHEEQAAAFGMPAIGTTMSFLVAAGMSPEEAFQRIIATAAGVAEDLA